MHRYKTISAFQNEYAYPTPVNNQNDEHINSGGEINLSYIHRKSKFITKSIVAKAKIENIEYDNRLAYMQPVKNDSISRQFQTKPMNWIVGTIILIPGMKLIILNTAYSSIKKIIASLTTFTHSTILQTKIFTL